MLNKVLFLFPCSLILLLPVCNAHSDDAQTKSVEVAEVKYNSVVKSARLIGRIHAVKESSIFARISGYIEKIAVENSQDIHKGDLILKLSNANLEEQYLLAKKSASLAAAQYKRMQMLFEKSSISAGKLDESEQLWVNAQIKLHEVEKELEKISILAPFDGRIGSFKFTEGAMVNSGDVIVTLYDLSKYVVEFSVSTNIIDKFQVGQLVQLGQNEGNVVSVQLELDKKTQMGTVKAEIENCRDCVLGVTKEVTVLLGQRNQVLAIPNEAIIENNGKYSVYIVQDDHALLKNIEVGLMGDKKTEILSGLQENDIVVTRNQGRLYENVPVNIIQ